LAKPEIDNLLVEAIQRKQETLSAFSFYDKDFIGVHIRRGDYTSLSGYHGLASQRYYYLALSKIKSNENKLPIVVFSDDILEAKRIIFDATTYVGPEYGLSPVENLFLMGNAKAFIGSNSSYSWWASYLLKIKGKNSVYFPSPWFAKASLSSSDILYPEWRVIKN
jgi:hypothetical protein